MGRESEKKIRRDRENGERNQMKRGKGNDRYKETEKRDAEGEKR